MNLDLELNPVTLRPSVMEVNLDALTKNFQTIQHYSPNSIVMPVVKANAYGHGLVVCGKHLEEIGAKFLGVAFVEEGITLRQAGVTIPILVMGGIFDSQIQYFIDYELDITASSVSKLEAINETASSLGKQARVHLKIDTGMERVGVHYYSAEKIFNKARECSNCDIVGIYSHFAAAERPDLSLTRTQLERFLECSEAFYQEQEHKPLRHIARSAALMSFKESHLDMVRTGISLYGVYPAEHLRETIKLEPVMTLRSKVVFFKVVQKGAGVSYGHTWCAPKDTRIVTVPIGYGDGYSRRLSNKADVLINDKRYPVVGTVCMDQIMIDVGEDDVFVGDEVVLIGRQGKEQITIGEIAEKVGTSTHEVLVSTNMRVPRQYKRGDEVFRE